MNTKQKIVAMYGKPKKILRKKLDELEAQGLYKHEFVLHSPQGVWVRNSKGDKLLNLCANNYLGLSSHPDVLEAATRAIQTYGYGLSSVRFICGTQQLHKILEERLTEFLGTEDTIVYSSAFDANGGLFEALFEAEDVIFSDSLNHASIIDGIRLCKAERKRYPHANMTALENALKDAKNARMRAIVTDGVFSMDGHIAPLDEIVALANKYDALTIVDDCHATGVLGDEGRGTHEYHGCAKGIDVITGTLGKALGGASGGFVSGRKEIVQWLRQTSRPYLFSNSLAPAIAGGALEALKIISHSTRLKDKLNQNTQRFRQRLTEVGFDIKGGQHPIVPIMIYDSVLAQKMAERLREQGFLVISFHYPVVPKGQARLRVRLSASHEPEQLEDAVRAFEKEGMALGLI